MTLAEVALERRTSRNALQVYLLAFCAVAGVSQLSAALRPNSIRTALPLWMQLVWLVMLITGSCAALVGMYWRRPYVGMQIESLGLLTVAVPAITYSIGLVGASGVRGLFVAILTLGLGAAFLHRYRQINHTLRLMRRLE